LSKGDVLDECRQEWRMNDPSVSSAILHALTVIVFAIHISAGTIALVSGTVAGFARKGGYLHRKAGKLFVASMLAMALFAAYLAVAMPDQIVNVFISTLVAYLVASAWMTVRRREGTTGVGDKIALVVAIVLWTPFAILSFQLATGMTPLFKSAVPFEGPVLVAIYSFTVILTLAVVGDALTTCRYGFTCPRCCRSACWSSGSSAYGLLAGAG
jgi:uncharacterized membrane protein